MVRGAQMGVLGHGRQEPTFHSSSDMNGCKEGEGLEIAVPLQSTWFEMEPWIIGCMDSGHPMWGFFSLVLKIGQFCGLYSKWQDQEGFG